jgi:hypothetical protein
MFGGERFTPLQIWHWRVGEAADLAAERARGSLSSISAVRGRGSWGHRDCRRRELGPGSGGKFDGGDVLDAFTQGADEEDAAAMLFRELGEVVERACDIVGAMTFDGPEVAVQGIEGKTTVKSRLQR